MDERNVAEPIAPLICCESVAWSIPRRSAGLNLTELGQRRSTSSFYALVAHLLQQFVDERASEQVEKIGSNPSMDA